jgi:hypothetical protein
MNAFEAAEKNGRASDLQKELEDLFNSQNKCYFHSCNVLARYRCG